MNDQAAKMIAAIKENIARVIVGKQEVVDYVLTALIAEGHILLEDVPGTGKTMLAKTLAKSIGISFRRIQFTPDLLPSDITGLNYFQQKSGEFKLFEGPVFTNILLGDEINRATPRTQSSLLECMEEKQVTIDGETKPLEAPFFVIATQNPVETAGTFPLPEAQLDRFLMLIPMGYPTKEEELEIMTRFMGENPLAEMETVCTKEDLRKLQKAYQSVTIHTDLLRYIQDIVAETRQLKEIELGVSPRGTLAFLRAAQAYALIKGREYVIPEDVKQLAVPVLAHRLVLFGGNTTTDASRKAIRQVLERVPVPTEDWSNI